MQKSSLNCSEFSAQIIPEPLIVALCCRFSFRDLQFKYVFSWEAFTGNENLPELFIHVKQKQLNTTLSYSEYTWEWNPLIERTFDVTACWVLGTNCFSSQWIKKVTFHLAVAAYEVEEIILRNKVGCASTIFLTALNKNLDTA